MHLELRVSGAVACNIHKAHKSLHKCEQKRKCTVKRTHRCKMQYLRHAKLISQIICTITLETPCRSGMRTDVFVHQSQMQPKLRKSHAVGESKREMRMRDRLAWLDVTHICMFEVFGMVRSRGWWLGFGRPCSGPDLV